MPPGGMIGGAPGVGLGQPTTARPSAKRINPIGGIIGETQPQNRAGVRGATGEHMGGYGMPYGQNGARNPGRDERGDGSHWDPDNPWETAEGVSPVVMPSREQRIDPGPAIGLG